MQYNIYEGDIMRWAQEYSGEPFHALLCDPPYHLTEPNSARSSYAERIASGRTGEDKAARRGGFMGKEWDGGDVAFRPETWAALAQHLYPGAFGMAFASSRGWHRLACAIEDAGLIIHPSIFLYSYGTGFPKATRVPDNRFTGHRYGLQSLKPAGEPLITFHKPFTVNQYCATICRVSALTEAALCTLLPALNAESLTNQIHQKLQAVAGHFAQSDVGVWASLDSAMFAERPFVSSPANLTLRDFVAAPALTPDAMRHQARITLIGTEAVSSVRGMPISGETARLLESIAQLWSNCLSEFCEVPNMFTIETETNLTTDLRTYKSLLLRIMRDYTTKDERTGLTLLAASAISVLASLLGKLPLLKSTSAHASVTKMLAEMENDQAASKTEPIIVFQRPYQGRAVESITRTGAGALNIDGGRVVYEPDGMKGAKRTSPRPFCHDGTVRPRNYAPVPAGRWPSNLILLHTAACNGVCHPDCPVERMGAQSGESTADNRQGGGSGGIWSSISNQSVAPSCGDTGTAARFFQQSDWMLDRLDAADPVRYVAKPSVAEREAGLEGWPSTTVDDGRPTPIDNAYQRGETERRNTHPTVKPIDLARYLATLLLPPPEYGPRRLLVPFAGSGTEMIGAGLAGWEYCQGIELEAPHVTIAEARLAWWIDVFGKAAAV